MDFFGHSGFLLVANLINFSTKKDALTSARKYYIYLTNSGVAKSIKRGYNKRFRRVQKEELRKGDDE